MLLHVPRVVQQPVSLGVIAADKFLALMKHLSKLTEHCSPRELPEGSNLYRVDIQRLGAKKAAMQGGHKNFLR